MGWTPDQARALAERIFSFSRAEGCAASLLLSERGHTRFAANEVTTAGSARTAWVAVTSRAGGRAASARTTGLDDDSLRGAAARSEALLAALGPQVPPVIPGSAAVLGPQDYPAIPGFDEATAGAGPLERGVGVKAALDRARGRGLDASGVSRTEARWAAIADTSGNFGFHRATVAAFSTTMRTADGTGSGYAAGFAPRLSDIDPSALAERAARKAESSSRPLDFAPGRYTVILEPEAVADLLHFLPPSLDALAAAEGRSFLAKPGGGDRLGEKLFADAVTLRFDPFDPRNPGSPWVGGGAGLDFRAYEGGAFSVGLPARRTTWVEDGVVRSLAVDGYWSRAIKAEPAPYSGSLVMEGSGKSLDALIAETERALLVTRFWYTRMVNPHDVEVTGLTRDGVWLVEGGQVVHPIHNLRFNDGPVHLLRDLESIGVATPAGSASTPMIVPAVRARDFNFTARSDAV